MVGARRYGYDQAVARKVVNYFAQRTAKRYAGEEESVPDQLTNREMEVMRCVLTGSLNKQIAAHLGIAEKTVKVHRGRVMTKMDVSPSPISCAGARWWGLDPRRWGRAPTGRQQPDTKAAVSSPFPCKTKVP